jgi:uncharacterized protein YndB with AHSA1/START domain/predicted Ser/Thr protein kinase
MANRSVAQGEPTSIYAGGPFVPPSAQELGARLANLEVLELLGHGGMGVVYKGRQPLLDRMVAIKVLRPDFGAQKDFQARFMREARLLAKLRHPYIVTVFDVGKSEDLYYLVMEFVDGKTLRGLGAEQRLTQRDALDFVPQIAEALVHAHEAGIVHRDVKPENVLVDQRGRVRLVDFGLASLFGDQYRRDPDDSRVAGTWGYMAPEQITRPESVDHRADIYSTGVVLYEMLTGGLPRGDYPAPSQSAGTDRRLDPIVSRAMEKERERRYQEARLLHADLLQVTRTPESTIRIECEVPAPLERVFAAWTNAEELARWFGPTDDYMTTAQVDLTTGGHYKLDMQPCGTGQPCLVVGQFCKIDAPHSVSFTWQRQPPAPAENETQVTVQFQPKGECTNLVLIHDRFRDKEIRQRHADGWAGCLGRLARKLND